MNDHCEPFAADCAVRLAAELTAHTWDPVVLMALRAGRRRRIDLLGAIAGVSDEVLTRTLRARGWRFGARQSARAPAAGCGGSENSGSGTGPWCEGS